MTSPTTSDSASKPSPKSTLAYDSVPVELPIPASMKVDQTTLQMALSVVMGLLGLALHLWGNHKEK